MLWWSLSMSMIFCLNLPQHTVSSFDQNSKQKIQNLRNFLTIIYYDTFFNWPTEKKKVFWSNNIFCLLFQLLTLKILGKTRFVVWWFDPMSSLMIFYMMLRIREA